MRIFDRIISREPVEKGWSGDCKYKARTADGEQYFLRISPREQYEIRKLQFRHMELVRDLGVRVSGPVEFGCCPEGCYTILEWVRGRDAEAVLPGLSGQEQYRWGLEAGRMLRTIHSIRVPFVTVPWGVRYEEKLDKKLEAYRKSPLKFEKGALYLELLERDRYLAEGRPTVWCHGDFHCGNLMFDEQMRLTVIDFDREDISDPWYEFNRIIWDVRMGAMFASGMVDGYFDGDVPEEFWPIMRLYQAQNMISSLPWSLDFGETEIRMALENGKMVLGWYDDLQKVVPNWYTTGSV